MYQAQEAIVSPYPVYEADPYDLDTAASLRKNAYCYPTIPPDPIPVPVVPVPYPAYPAVTYDPFWPSKVTPSHRPLLLVPPPWRRFPR